MQTNQSRILMIVGDFVEDYECFTPMQMMMMMNYCIDIVSPDKNKGDHIITAVHDCEDTQTYTEKRGHRLTITCDWNKVKVESYDGLILPGGRSPEFLRTNTTVTDLVKTFLSKNKPIAAICHGIQMLTPTGMLKGRTLTGYPSVGIEVELAGGTFKKMNSDESMVDGNLVTSPSWPGIHSWMAKFLKLLQTKTM